MDFQGRIDRTAAEFDPTRDVIVAMKPLKFGDGFVQADQPLSPEQLAEFTDQRLGQLIRTRFVKVIPGARTVPVATTPAPAPVAAEAPAEAAVEVASPVQDKVKAKVAGRRGRPAKKAVKE